MRKGTALIVSSEGSWIAVSCTWRLKSARMRCSVSEPIAIAKAQRITNVSSAETPARRTRIGNLSKLAERLALVRLRAPGSLGAEDVAGPSDGVQKPLLALGLQLATEVRDEHLDRVGRRERVIAPHLIE